MLIWAFLKGDIFKYVKYMVLELKMMDLTYILRCFIHPYGFGGLCNSNTYSLKKGV